MRDVGSIFQSTLPAREATKGLIDLAYRSGISIHASREGSDCPVSVAGDGAGVISIHASREGSDLADDAAALLLDISIHASREGSDLLAAFDGAFHHDFNPRFPRGKRLLNSLYSFSCWLFQSTLPAREATHRSHPPRWGRNHFNPRFPRGKRPQADVQHDVRLHFNPRFPRGKRLCNPVFPLLQERFQSTLPAREATTSPPARDTVLEFQSTLPAREATRAAGKDWHTLIFQSTLPAREATPCRCAGGFTPG